jgi:hypothetical protein
MHNQREFHLYSYNASHRLRKPVSTQDTGVLFPETSTRGISGKDSHKQKYLGVR